VRQGDEILDVVEHAMEEAHGGHGTDLGLLKPYELRLIGKR
jgi:hypothetical protein